MPDLTVIPLETEPAFPSSNRTVIRQHIALEALTKGQAIYTDPTTGKAGVADANVAGRQQFRGIALSTCAANAAVRVLEEGEIKMFDLTGVNADAFVYLSDTAGRIGTTVGTMTVPIGRVRRLTDTPTMTKVVLVQVNWLANFA